MLKKLVQVSALTLALVASAHAASGSDAPRKIVEVNLGGPLLSFASVIAKTQDAETAALIKSLKSVSTRVYDMSGHDRPSALAALEKLRVTQLDKSWSQVANVSDPSGNDVNVFVKQKNDDVIEGFVVTVLEQTGKGVIVEITGELRADQIAKVAQNLDLPGMEQLRGDRGSKNLAEDSDAT